MKNFKSIIIGAAGLLALSSCNDWLDVNVDPNNPTDLSAPYYQRLAFIEFYTNQSYQTASEISNYLSGNYAHTGRTHARGGFCAWNVNIQRSQSVAQSWYNGAVPNFKVYFKTAEAAGAYHYVGVGHLLRAYGFANIMDFMGESPMSDADTDNLNPRYDTGKEIFTQVLAEIDLGIENLQKPQEAGAVALSANDYIGHGDVARWIKFGYLLKARTLNKLLKKGAGSASDLKYDADEILRCLEKAPQSNADAMIIAHEDVTTTDPKPDQLGINERLEFNPMFSNTGMNNNSLYTKMYEDNLTNFAGNGVEDPRADRILPWIRSRKSDDTPADIKWSEDGKWRRAKGLDIQSTIRVESAPFASSYDANVDGWRCVNASEARRGDTIYVLVRASSKVYSNFPDLLNRTVRTNDNSASSSSFFFRAITPGFFSTYHEACFIKAEVLFNKGDRNGAYEAYTKAVRAQMDLMNNSLNVWVNDSPTTKGCPAFEPMTEQEMTNFIQNGLGTANDLTLGKIMTQKHISMFCTMETWNDMRRYDFDPQIFLNYNKPGEYLADANSQQLNIPQGKYPRRMRINKAETDYNVDQVNAIGPSVAGANTSYAGGWQFDPTVWTVPVWWDSTEN